ncbi:MAG: glycosyl hydrolase, partial [Armatimonadota bacterium]
QGSYGIGDFTVSDDGQSIWVGTGEFNSQRTSYAGTGVYHSPDGGKTWQHMGLPESHHISKIIVNPKNPNEVYVGVLGHLYSQNPERGVYKTTDGGKTWEQVLKLNEWTGIADMAMDPRDPKVLYACAWERDRRAWDMVESGPGSAIYKSTDGGKNWVKQLGLPEGNALGRPSIAIAPTQPDRVYLFIDNHGPDDSERDEAAPSGKLTLQRFVLMSPEAFKALPAKLLADYIHTVMGAGTDENALAKQVNDGTLTKEKLLDLFRTKKPQFYRVGT